MVFATISKTTISTSSPPLGIKMAETYKVVTGRYETEIIERVNNWVEQGWVIHGGISVAVGTTTIFAQAMVRRIEDVMEELIDTEDAE
jgi:hypothetical protein